MQESQKKAEYLHSTTCNTQIASLDSQSKHPNSHQSPIIQPTKSMKMIIAEIRKNSFKRIRQQQRNDVQRQCYNQQIQHIINNIQLKGRTCLHNAMTIHQISNITFLKEAEMEIIVKKNQEKKKKIIDSFDILKKVGQAKSALQLSLRNLKLKNKNSFLELSYFKSLIQTLLESQVKVANISKTIKQQQGQFYLLQIQIEDLQEQYEQVIEQLKQIHHFIQDSQILHILLSQRCNQFSKQKIPNQEEMINCMFLVGVLKEQIYILFLQKKQKWNEKAPNQNEKINKYLKIYQQFSRRTIKINIKKSQIIYFNILIAIYMHCKSLVTNNLVSAMNTLSFFSDQFKIIYCYRTFQKYMTSLIEKSKLNFQWQKMKSIMHSGIKQTQICKKDLIIIVKEEHYCYAYDILQLFQCDNEYYVNLGNAKMRLQLKIIEKEHRKNNNEEYSLKSQILSNSENNQLYLIFDN